MKRLVSGINGAVYDITGGRDSRREERNKEKEVCLSQRSACHSCSH